MGEDEGEGAVFNLLSPPLEKGDSREFSEAPFLSSHCTGRWGIKRQRTLMLNSLAEEIEDGLASLVFSVYG
jgi:hypothetical protein